MRRTVSISYSFVAVALCLGYGYGHGLWLSSTDAGARRVAEAVHLRLGTKVRTTLAVAKKRMDAMQMQMRGIKPLMLARREANADASQRDGCAEGAHSEAAAAADSPAVLAARTVPEDVYLLIRATQERSEQRVCTASAQDFQGQKAWEAVLKQSMKALEEMTRVEVGDDGEGDTSTCSKGGVSKVDLVRLVTGFAEGRDPVSGEVTYRPGYQSERGGQLSSDYVSERAAGIEALDADVPNRRDAQHAWPARFALLLRRVRDTFGSREAGSAGVAATGAREAARLVSLLDNTDTSKSETQSERADDDGQAHAVETADETESETYAEDTRSEHEAIFLPLKRKIVQRIMIRHMMWRSLEALYDVGVLEKDDEALDWSYLPRHGM